MAAYTVGPDFVRAQAKKRTRQLSWPTLFRAAFGVIGPLVPWASAFDTGDTSCWVAFASVCAAARDSTISEAFFQRCSWSSKASASREMLPSLRAAVNSAKLSTTCSLPLGLMKVIFIAPHLAIGLSLEKTALGRESPKPRL